MGNPRSMQSNKLQLFFQINWNESILELHISSHQIALFSFDKILSKWANDLEILGGIVEKGVEAKKQLAVEARKELPPPARLEEIFTQPIDNNDDEHTHI